MTDPPSERPEMESISKIKEPESAYITGMIEAEFALDRATIPGDGESLSPMVDSAAGLGRDSYSRAVSLRYDSGKDLATDHVVEPKSARHWLIATRARRYALGCLVVGIILTAILVPVAILVIAPKIAQSLISGSTLQFISADIMNPREDGFTIHVVGKVENTGFLPARIVIPDPVLVSYQGQTIVALPLDPLDATPSGGATINSTADAKIVDAEAFAAFTKQMLITESFDWRLQGAVSATALGLTFNNLILDKVVTLKGFNGLKNVTILSFDLPTSDANGITLNIRANLVNPSPIGVEMGDMTFNVTLNGSTVGTSTSKNTYIRTGDNTLAMNGSIIPVTSALQQNLLTQMFTFFLAGQSSSLTVIGTDVRPSNATKLPISWLRQAFVGLPFDVTLPAKNKVQVITGIDLTTFAISFDPANPWSPSMSSPGIVAHLQMPFSFPLSISTVQMTINMLANQSSDVTIATIGTGWIPAVSTFNGTTGTMKVDLNQGKVVVPQDQRSAFAALMKTIFVGSGSVPVPVLVLSDATASTAAGNITIAKLPFSNSLPIRGLQALSATAPTIQSLIIVGGTNSYIDMTINTVLTNPSNVKLALNSDVVLELLYNGQVVGTVTIPNMVLNIGTNTITATARYFPQTPAALQAGTQLLTAYVNGDNANTVIQGTLDSSPIAPLAPALSSVSLPVTLPGNNIKPNLITGIQTTSFSIAFDPANPWAPKLSSPGMVTTLK
ncbi:hypothetical protein HDU93_007055, partial [Gonapodya sp. JEL0774]